ncbi:MAG: glycogen synthase, partial [bacterium]|nr:glycogen synthase [bacterium]
MADVTGSLPRALADLKQDVGIVLPLYREVRKKGLPLEPLSREFEIRIGARAEKARFFRLTDPAGFPVFFVENDRYFDRDYLYGTPAGDYPDNLERFSFFSRAVFELVTRQNLEPDVLHCHDWQTALVPICLHWLPSLRERFPRTATLLTLHNLGYQGIFPPEKFPVLGLPAEAYRTEGLEFWNRINLLKGGILAADSLNTVSRKYAAEIQTKEFGFGLEGVLAGRRRDLSGILDGVDYREWDPATDPQLAANFGPGDTAGKQACKQDLLKTFSFPPAFRAVPVIGMVSRLAEQKGIELLAEAIPGLMLRDLALIILASGDEHYQKLLGGLARSHPERLRVRLGFDDKLSRQIEAGSDMFLMPSRYEPCGLNQIISLKYGTVPIVRATGGLDDTVEAFDPLTGRGNGFKFKEYQAADLIHEVNRALQVFADPPNWKKLVANAMASDFSWKRPA